MLVIIYVLIKFYSGPPGSAMWKRGRVWFGSALSSTCSLTKSNTSRLVTIWVSAARCSGLQNKNAQCVISLSADEVWGSEKSRRGAEEERDGMICMHECYCVLFLCSALIHKEHFGAKLKAASLFQELTKREVVNVTHLVIPAELGALLQAAGGFSMPFLWRPHHCSNAYYSQSKSRFFKFVICTRKDLTSCPSCCSQEGAALRLFGSSSGSSYPGRGSAHSASGHQQLPILPLHTDLLQGELCIVLCTVLQSAPFQQINKVPL